MREIGIPKIGSDITDFHIKIKRITVILRIGSRKKAISQSHKCKIEDKKVAYIVGRLYIVTKIVIGTLQNLTQSNLT